METGHTINAHHRQSHAHALGLSSFLSLCRHLQRLFHHLLDLFQFLAMHSLLGLRFHILDAGAEDAIGANVNAVARSK